MNKRADYGKRIIISISCLLTENYGNSYSEKSIRRMMQFAETFPDEQIVVSAIRQLSWTHFIALIPLKNSIQRDFYIEMCKMENWNVKTLREKIDSMLFERTAISEKPDELIKQELKALREDNTLTPDLIFRDPYFLDFLGLKEKKWNAGTLGFEPQHLPQHLFLTDKHALAEECFDRILQAVITR